MGKDDDGELMNEDDVIRDIDKSKSSVLLIDGLLI